MYRHNILASILACAIIIQYYLCFFKKTLSNSWLKPTSPKKCFAKTSMRRTGAAASHKTSAPTYKVQWPQYWPCYFPAMSSQTPRCWMSVPTCLRSSQSWESSFLRSKTADGDGTTDMDEKPANSLGDDLRIPNESPLLVRLMDSS